MPPGRPKRIDVTFREVVARSFAARCDQQNQLVFPNPRYAQDPSAYCREILGFRPWHKQVEMLEAVRDHLRVAVRTGHKIGKSRSAAALASWFYDSFVNARVIMTSTTDHQVNNILWRELRMLRAEMGVCVECKAAKYRGPKPCPHSAVSPGELAERARTGLKAPDFREVVGFTAAEPEAVAGISGPNMLYIVDEASGVPDEIYEAIEGNRAGGARIVLFGNPTRNEGEFYDAFYDDRKRAVYKGITISSEETPNVVEQRDDVVPGLATYAWVEEKKKEWGEDSAAYMVRVKGLHATKEEGRIFSLHTIGQAEQRWDVVPAEGFLQLGIDPAGPTGSGDDSGFSVRRGYKQLALRRRIGLTAEAHLVEALSLIAEFRELPDEIPLVMLDSEGQVGAKVFGYMQAFAEQNPRAFKLGCVRASDRATREPMIYDKQRDALVSNFEGWIKDGGALVTDSLLAHEMHQYEYFRAASNGRYKVTPKDVIRKRIGRSPDSFDATTLSVWVPTWYLEELGAPITPASSGEHRGVSVPEEDDGPELDPYAGAAAFRR